MDENIKKRIQILYNIKKTKIQIIILLLIYISWILTSWPQTLSYNHLQMDSYGTFQYVYPLFWGILLLCTIFLLFSNAHLNIKTLYCIMLGLLTFGTLSLIQQLGTHHDSVSNLMTAIDYINSGFIVVGTDPRNSYPLTYILWGTLMMVCNISLESLLKYHAILITILYAVSGLLLGKYFFQNKHMDDYYIYFIFFIFVFGTRFAIRLNPAPQTFGIITSLFFVALLFKHGIKFRYLQIILFMYICLSHAISGYYLICLLFAILLSYLILYLYTKNEKILNNFFVCLNIFTYALIIFISWFLYVAVFTSGAAINIAKQLINIPIQNSGESVSTLSNLYHNGDLPIEYFITNRFGWIILLLFIIIGILTISQTVLKREYEIGFPIISMGSIMSIQFFLSSYMTKYGSLLDRAFLFMIFPAGLTFAYFCGYVKNRSEFRRNHLRYFFIAFLLMIAIFGIFNVFLSHYTDNFDVITPTEKMPELNRNINTISLNNPIYIESKQDLNKNVIVSRQMKNIRTYNEGNLNNTLVELEKSVKNSPGHTFIYNNGNINYYMKIYNN